MRLNRWSLPKTRSRSRGDGNASLLFLFHPVHGGFTIIHLADFIRNPGIVENPFCGGGLACVNMGNDPDVAHLI